MSREQRLRTFKKVRSAYVPIILRSQAVIKFERAGLVSSYIELLVLPAKGGKEVLD